MKDNNQKQAFLASQNHVVPFGKYKGKSIDKIAETDEGLKYLDWLNGQSWLDGMLKNSLTVYLSDPTIKKELDAIT